MKTPLIILVALMAATAGAAAWAQNAPLRGVGLLALNASEPGSPRNALIEMPDSGGGSVGARALRGGDSVVAPRDRYGNERDVATTPDELPPRSVPSTDPAAPAAATPKRPTYRWQSLVPGAIK